MSFFTLLDGSGNPLAGERDGDTIVWDINRQCWKTTAPAGGSGTGVATAIRETSGPTDLNIGDIADGQVGQRVGATFVGVTPISGPADPGDNGKIPRASGGNFVYIGGAANDVLTWTGALWTNAKVVDANVDAAAAIAGTKVSPNFGAQNVATTGNFVTTGGSVSVKTATPVVQLGLDPGSGAGSAAATGNLRVGSAFTLVGLNSTNVTDRIILDWSAAISQLTIGTTSSFNVLYQASASHTWGIAGVTKFSIVSAEIRPAVPIVWSNGTDAAISQANQTTDGDADDFLITAQANTSNGTVTGGDLLMAGGACTNAGAVTSQTGGSCFIRGGLVSGSSGTRVHGSAGIRAPNGTDVVAVTMTTGSTVQLGFFAATPVAKQTLTDTTGGTPANALVDVNTAGVADVAKVNANFASIWTKINNYGLWA